MDLFVKQHAQSLQVEMVKKALDDGEHEWNNDEMYEAIDVMMNDNKVHSFCVTL